MHRARRRHLVVGAALALVTLGTTVAPASAQDPAPSGLARVGRPTVGARFEGTKGPSSSDRSAAPRAVGDVTITSEGCSPDPVAHGAQTTCTYRVQNQTQTATTVDLQATGDAELTVTGADLGAATNGGTARAEDVPLPPRTTSPIQVNAGSTFAGYYALETIPIPPQTITDDQVLNYTVQPYRWNGATYTSIGISANGYAVVGGADTAKDASASPQDMPAAGRPNNVLAPFWTDLTPAGGGSLRVATVANTAQPPCERSYWFVAQWDMFEFGTTTNRKAQLWIQADDPECATDPVPAETIYFTYDFATMTAPPARPFRIGAENSTGTAGGMRPVGQLPTDHYVVTSSGTAQAAPPVTWTVVGTGTAGGTGTVAATVESTLIPGSSTVFTDVTVTGQAEPTVTDHPDDETVTAGEQAVFTAAATGAGSVAWEVSTDDGGTWDPVPGADATTLAFTTGGGDDGNQYRAVFSNPTGTATATTDPATLTVEQIATTTSVVPSPAAPSVGQAVTFTASVFPAGATGTVQFSVDGTPLGGPVAVAGGTATSPSTSSLAPGDHTVTAVYSGDTDHAGSTGTGGVSVGKTLTTTSVALSPPAPLVGEGVTFTATVAPPGATGTVQFTLDGAALGGPVAVSGGTATSPAATGLERGGHVIVAAYSGDATRAMSTSGPVTFTVARRTTTTGVVVDPAAPQRGEAVTFTATVTPTPSGGSVQFSVDGNPVGAPVGVVGGTATSAPLADLPAGDHTVTAAYSGGEAHLPSTSSAVPFTVSKNPSTTTVSAVRPAVPSVGEDVEVDLEVSPAPAGGTVQVAVDGTPVGAPVTLDGSGRATVTLPGLVQGSRTVTATFSGDADLLGSADDATSTVYSEDEAFVRRAFPVVLGRAADAGGVAHWLGAMGDGATPGQVAAAMAASSEGRGRLVDQAYQRAMSRRPDADGRAYWVRRLASGLTAEDLLATLIASAEGYQRSGSSPDGTAITLFRVHLGRPAGTDDLAYWTDLVEAAGNPAGRRRVALAFGRSPEATAVAVRTAVDAACGDPGAATGAERSVLAQRWPVTGRHPLRLAGSALALVCPPGT